VLRKMGGIGERTGMKERTRRRGTEERSWRRGIEGRTGMKERTGMKGTGERSWRRGIEGRSWIHIRRKDIQGLRTGRRKERHSCFRRKERHSCFRRGFLVGNLLGSMSRG